MDYQRMSDTLNISLQMSCVINFFDAATLVLQIFPDP